MTTARQVNHVCICMRVADTVFATLNESPFIMDEYRDYADTQARRLEPDEVERYMSEQQDSLSLTRARKKSDEMAAAVEESIVAAFILV